MLLIVTAFTDRSTKYDNKAPIKMVHTRYSVTVAKMARDVGQRTWGRKDIDRLENGVRISKNISRDVLRAL